MRIGAVRDAGAVREQVADGDLAARRREHAAGVGARGDGGAREAREPAGDGIAERELSLLDEHEDGGAREGLRLRRDAEDRVGGHRLARLEVGPADGAFVDDDAIAHHERDGAGDPL
jgi:hypothetical protein